MKSDSRRLSFGDFIGRYSPFLRRLVREKIKQLEAEGHLPSNRRSVDGIFDETILLAWDRLPEQEKVGAEEWLTQVLEEVLKAAVEHARETTPAAPLDDLTDGEVGEVADYYQRTLRHSILEEDSPFWEDLLPDRKERDGARQLEFQETILFALNSLSATDRMTFSLYAFEGYDCEEIAMIQRRDVSEVEHVIAAARNKVKDYLASRL